MMIHIWRHWFWITTASFKGILLFTVQMISLSCISYPLITEAGLLGNESLISQNPYLNQTNGSSQVIYNPNITSQAIANAEEKNLPLEIKSHQSSPPSSPEEVSTEALENEATSKSEDVSRIDQSSASDMVDTFNGGSLDVFQYPLKKFTKYSHLKYGKVKTKGKASEESVAVERKAESVKIIEDKVNLTISIAGDGHAEPEIDKLNDSLAEGNSSQSLPSETVDLVTTTLTVENSTFDVETESANETVSTEEPVLKDEPAKSENATTTSSTPEAKVSETLNATGDQKDVQVVKNETLVIENKVAESVVHTTVEPFLVKNRVAAATSAHNFNDMNQSGLNAGSITGITLGILVVFSLFGAVSFVLYRRRYLNKPQVLHDKCSNLDSSGYIDETSFRENSEEMYSLDNDSFLNSLEAMTIQNYWTENVKHTKL